MKNLIKTILEINDASYRWYLMIILSLIIINLIIPNSLKNLGISSKLLFFIFIISSALRIYHKRLNIKRSTGLLIRITKNKSHQIFLYLGGILIITWVISKNNNVLSLRSYLMEVGFSNFMTFVLFSVLFFVMFVCILNDHENNNLCQK